MLSKDRKWVCSHCGVIGEPDKIGLGLFSGLVAIFGAIATMVGLALSVVPGLIFGILTATHIMYYQNKNGVECRHCRSKNSMVPKDATIVVAAIKKFERI